MHVRDHRAPVVVGGQELLGELVERAPLGACHLDGAVERPSKREIGQRGGNVIRRNGLEESGRQADHVVDGAGFDDGADELEELCRAQDRVGNPGGLDQIFLGHFGAQVAAVGKAVGADDGQGEVMSDARGRFRGQQIATGRLEEFHNGLVFERWRVRHVDDDLCARKRCGQSLTGDGVDARIGRRRHDLVAALTQPVHKIGADETAASDDDDLHVDLHSIGDATDARRMPKTQAENIAATMYCYRVHLGCLSKGPRSVLSP